MKAALALPGVEYERQAWARELVCAGIDEAGRGPLFGPLMVGAVILNEHDLPEAYDSKSLSAARREELAQEVREKAISHAVGAVSAREIDDIGMSSALSLAARRAIDGLVARPDRILVDGPRDFTRSGIEAVCLVKGETHSRSIAAASLLAKVAHDDVVRSLATQFPGYGIERNMGYGTAEHMEALRCLGPTSEHRRSFRPVREVSSDL